MSDFKTGLLELLALMHEEQLAQGRRLEEVTRVCVETADEVRTVRSRLIEQASRHGEEINEHAKVIARHAERIGALERQVSAGVAADPDA